MPQPVGPGTGILIPYRPRTVVFYAADNDIAAGETSPQVADGKPCKELLGKAGG